MIAWLQVWWILLHGLFSQMVYPFPGPRVLTPPPPAGMAIWWSADVGNNCGGVACTDGASQDSWHDQSGNGNDGTLFFTPAVTTPCTASVYHTNQINGKPAVTFNGSPSDPVTCFSNGGSSGGIDNKAATTIFIVVKNAGVSYTSTMAAGGSNSLVWDTSSSGKTHQMNQGSTSNIANSTSNGDNNWHQLNVTYNSSSGAYAFRTDRAADGSGTNAKTISNNWLDLGISLSGGALASLNGQVAEFILYTSVLSAGDITTVETYLNAKYGL